MGGFVKTTCEDYEYLMPCVSSIYTAGPGIDISSDNVISNTGVLSINGQTGHVIIQAGDVTFSPYPNTFNTTGTTAEFLSSIASLNLPTGSAYLGQVSLSDMPEGVTVQGDVEVYVYPQNVIYAIMRSAEVEPYQWVVDSYSNTHYGRGWIPVGNYVVESTTPSVAVEGMLWYDTTNNVVKVYDGTNWNEIGEGEIYTAGTNITIDANNEISAVDTTYSAGTYLTLNGTTFDVDTTLIATKSDLANFAGFEVVATLPQDPDTNIIYLKGPIGTGTDKYEEWIYSNSTWVQIGETSIDLTDCAQKSEVLVKTNTISYTPTGSYNPATKKYVDDSISAITIPTVNDATLTITQNGVSAGTFTANASANTTIALTDTTYTAGEGISIGDVQDYSAMRGPALEGFHVPLHTEWGDVYNIRVALGGGGTDVAGFGTALKLPLAGYRSSDTNINWLGTIGRYWASDELNANSYRLSLSLQLGQISPNSRGSSIGAYSLRCFKDEPVIPTNSWTKLYGTSIEAGGIFWNSTDGLISLSSDGNTWITIADKNLGATQVWNNGDTLSEANCGKYYQWGNNYGFPRTGTISNTSATQVDTTGYGPGNYYSSDIYITYNGNWFNPNNSNLRGGDTGVVQTDNVITNTGVLSVNGQTGHVTVSAGEGNTKTFYLSGTSDLTTAQAIYDWYLAGKDPIIVYNDEAYTLGNNIDNKLIFYGNKTFPVNNTASSSGLLTHRLALSYSSQVVTSIDNNGVTESSRFLVTNYDYSIPYTPQYSGSPTTKKYVDDGDTYIGSSAPSSPVEGKLWYDTTNDVLKTYDGTNWNSTGGSFSQVQADWNQTNSGAVDFIKNKPTIPAAQIQSDWNQSDSTKLDYIKNKPTIPTVNNATLTIQQEGVTLTTFDANSNTNKTANIQETVKSGDSGTTYVIKTSNSEPAVGTANNIITFVL